MGISGLRKTKAWFRKYDSVRGGTIPDGIKPWVYNHRNHMVFQTFIAKYAQSLEGGKVVLRDVIVSKKKKDESKTDAQSTKKNYNKSQYKHKKKAGGVGNKKMSGLDVRIAAELEVKKKERDQKLQK